MGPFHGQARTRRDDLQPLSRGIYTARLARSAADIAATQGLRHLSFRVVRGLAVGTGRDEDGFDAGCQHVMVHQGAEGPLVASCRVRIFGKAEGLNASYAAQFFDLAGFSGLSFPMMELGRFCLHPDHRDPDILRLTWAALTRLVDDNAVAMLFGCSSFDGADPGLHQAALAFLAAHHLGPVGLAPMARAVECYDMRVLAETQGDPRSIPALLRTYLAMGGWVAGQAVLDRDLNTLMVFTGLDTGLVPAARARALRALSG